jgi:hypothetical protein
MLVERGPCPCGGIDITGLREHLGDFASWAAVRPTIHAEAEMRLQLRFDAGIAANAPTVASSRLCQSRLSRAKMSPNRWRFRKSSMVGANS